MDATQNLLSNYAFFLAFRYCLTLILVQEVVFLKIFDHDPNCESLGINFRISINGKKKY